MSEFPPYIDVHTHRYAAPGETVSVLSVELGQLPQHPQLPRWCCVGRHPWHAAAESGGSVAKQLDAALGTP
ncbi:MAG: hypothetical protein KFF77_01700, partial [Bacteroidetes bacterium]|nr:hypothetical protein [Bacteroidota bacterium]